MTADQDDLRHLDLPVDPVALADLAEDVARGATEILAAGQGRHRTSITTKSTATDLVTEVDRASEQFVVDALLAARPDDGLLGEEGASRAGSSGIRWVIDPLDGTTNYVYGHIGYSVSIAAEWLGAGEPVLLAGVVVDAVVGDVFRAAIGHGSTRNGIPIHASSETDLSQALLATGFAYDGARRTAWAEVIAGVIGQVRDIRRVGSAALDLCSVACGRVDVYAEPGLAPWDRAAGTLIAREADAIVTGFATSDPSVDGLVAGPPALLTPLRDLIVASGHPA